MRWYFGVPLGTRLVAAFAAGAGVGLLMGPEATIFAPASRLLIDVLRLLAPIVVGTFVLSALSAGSPRTIGVTAGKALAGFVVFAAVAAAIGVLTVAPLKPIHLTAMPAGTLFPPTGWWSTLTGWLPGRGTGLERAVPLVFALTAPLALGLGAWRSNRAGGLADRIHGWTERLTSAVARALGVVLEYAPVGAFASAAVMFGEAGSAAGASLAGAVAGVYAAHAVLAMILLATAAAFSLRPFQLVRESREALVTAVATGSSAATLPLELRVAERALAVPSDIARTVMPLGTTFSKMGTTAFLGALGVAGGMASGMDVTWPWMAQVVVWSTIAGIATPPISGGGFVMLALVFGQTGVPLAWVPVLTGLPFIGKLNTPLNALGRLVLVAALRPAPMPWPALSPPGGSRFCGP